MSHPLWTAKPLPIDGQWTLSNDKPVELNGVKYWVEVRLLKDLAHRPQGQLVLRQICEDNANEQ